jgi:hypothetical protein
VHTTSNRTSGADLKVPEEGQADEASEGWDASKEQDAAKDARGDLFWDLLIGGACKRLLLQAPWMCLTSGLIACWLCNAVFDLQRQDVSVELLPSARSEPYIL